MKTYIFVVSAFLYLSACTWERQNIKEVIANDPEIIFSIIESHPDRFIEVVNSAASKAQQNAQVKARKREIEAREKMFLNPLKPANLENRVFWGPERAKVTIVEYSDFECPFCARGKDTIKKLIEEYDGQVRVLFKHLPLDFHPNAMPAALMFEAIALQSAEKAKLFHEKVFAGQSQLRSDGDAVLQRVAREIGVDLEKMKKAIRAEKVARIVNADIEEARKFGFDGTPGYLINGVPLKGARSITEFREIINRHLKEGA